MSAIVVEQAITPQRLTELGALAWPVWKDPVGSYTQHYDAAEQSYFLDGEVLLRTQGGTPVRVCKGDLVIIPAGDCAWEVRVRVRRHYRSDALSPACCIT